MKEVLDRLDKIDGRLTKIDARLDGMDTRFDRMDEKFAAIDARFDGIDARFAAIDVRFDGVDARFDGIDKQLQKQGVLLEASNSIAKMALEGIIGNRQVMDEKFDEVLKKLDERVQPVEAAVRHVTRTLTTPAAGPRSRRKRRA